MVQPLWKVVQTGTATVKNSAVVSPRSKRRWTRNSFLRRLPKRNGSKPWTGKCQTMVCFGTASSESGGNALELGISNSFLTGAPSGLWDRMWPSLLSSARNNIYELSEWCLSVYFKTPPCNQYRYDTAIFLQRSRPFSILLQLFLPSIVFCCRGGRSAILLLSVFLTSSFILCTLLSCLYFRLCLTNKKKSDTPFWMTLRFFLPLYFASSVSLISAGCKIEPL